MANKPLNCIAIASMVLLTGCSSFGLGKTEFSCPGGIDGVHCRSAREIYQATHHSDTVKADNKYDEAGDKQVSVHVKASPVLIPSIDQPIPIRTQPEVMRIWVAPWQDQDGDLHADGFIYTEIERRKWNLGGRIKSPAAILYPLNAKNTASR